MSEPNYYTKKWFSKDLLVIEIKKTKVEINKPVYLGLSMLDIGKTLMHEFLYDHIKPKYQNNAILCYMDSDIFIIQIKIEDFYNDIADNFKNKYDTSNYEVDRPLPKGIDKSHGLNER